MKRQKAIQAEEEQRLRQEEERLMVGPPSSALSPGAQLWRRGC